MNHKTHPKINEFYFRDAKNVLHVYDVLDPTCHIRFENNCFVFFLHCRTSNQTSPSQEPTHLPWISVDLVFLGDPTQELVCGARFPIPISDEKFDPTEPLTNIYYGTHQDLKNAELLINDVTHKYIDATIFGVDEKEVIVRAKFLRKTRDSEHTSNDANAGQ